MTRNDTSIDFSLPSPSFEMRSYVFFVKWPAPDLKLLIITIITHIVRQSLALTVFSFFRIRQQRASTIYKQCEKRKANLIAISLFGVEGKQKLHFCSLEFDVSFYSKE